MWSLCAAAADTLSTSFFTRRYSLGSLGELRGLSDGWLLAALCKGHGR